MKKYVDSRTYVPKVGDIIGADTWDEEYTILKVNKDYLSLECSFRIPITYSRSSLQTPIYKFYTITQEQVICVDSKEQLALDIFG